MENERTSGSERTILEGLLHYGKILWKYRLLIVAITGAITLATLIFSVISIALPPDKSPLPNVYKAEAVILVEENNQPDIASSILTALGTGPTQNTGSRDNGNLIIEVLQSRWMLDSIISEFSIIERYGIAKNVKGVSRAMVLEKASFTYTPTTGALRISYEDIDPVFAKNLVNKMVSLLGAWFNQNRGVEKQKQRQLLEDKITEVKTSIDSLQNRLKSLQKRYGVLDVQELGQSQAATIANLRAQLILKDVEIKNYTSFSKIDDPRLEQLKEERQNLLDLIAQNQQKLPEAQQFSEVAGSESRGGGSKTLADVAQEFSQLTLELEIQQRIYNTLSPQYEAVKLTPETEPIFQILEVADIPDVKSGPERPKIIMLAFVLGLFVSMGAALMLNVVLNFKSKLTKMKSGQGDIRRRPNQ